MGVDLWSAPTPIGSPRLSFSRDSPPQSEPKERRFNTSLLSEPPAADFDFGIFTHNHLSTATADELFSNGWLLPLNGFSPDPDSVPTIPNSVPPDTVSERKERLKEIIACPQEETESGKATNPVKASFWRFRRSSSLNCGGCGAGHKYGGLICSLQLLPRSKSAGSDSNPPAALKHQRISVSGTISNAGSLRKSNSTSKSSPFSLQQPGPSSYYYGSSKKGGSGVRISPVLNVPPPYFAKGSGGGFFGFGHLFCSGKEKSSAKKKALFSGQS